MGLKRIRSVMFTFCRSLLPVITGIFLGLDRTSNMIGLCTQGIIKCVPSPTTWFFIPVNLSKITALWPPSTKTDNSKKIINKIQYISHNNFVIIINV